MPVSFGTDPQSAMGQQAPQLGDMGAPPGAGMLAAPSAGLPPMQAGTPQAAQMIAQIASNLLDKVKGTQYGQALLKHFSTTLTKFLASQILDDHPAKHDVMDAVKKLESAGSKLTQSGPSQSPALGTTLASMVQGGGAGGAGGGGTNSGMTA